MTFDAKQGKAHFISRIRHLWLLYAEMQWCVSHRLIAAMNTFFAALYIIVLKNVAAHNYDHN